MDGLDHVREATPRAPKNNDILCNFILIASTPNETYFASRSTASPATKKSMVTCKSVSEDQKFTTTHTRENMFVRVEVRASESTRSVILFVRRDTVLPSRALSLPCVESTSTVSLNNASRAKPAKTVRTVIESEERRRQKAGKIEEALRKTVIGDSRAGRRRRNVRNTRATLTYRILRRTIDPADP